MANFRCDFLFFAIPEFLRIAEFRSPGANPRAGWCCYFPTPCAAGTRRLSGNGVTHSRVGGLIWSAIAMAPDSPRIIPHCKPVRATNSAYHFFGFFFQTCRRASNPFQFCNGPNLSTNDSASAPKGPLIFNVRRLRKGTGWPVCPLRGKPPHR